MKKAAHEDASFPPLLICAYVHNTNRVILRSTYRVPHFPSRFPQKKEGAGSRLSSMPDRNNTNQPQSNSFRRFCTAETCQYLCRTGIIRTGMPFPTHDANTGAALRGGQQLTLHAKSDVPRHKGCRSRFDGAPRKRLSTRSWKDSAILPLPASVYVSCFDSWR